LRTLKPTKAQGFDEIPSMTTACMVIQDYVATELDKNKIVLMYSADLSSAFDLLIPSQLATRLIELNIPSRIFKCIHNYLLDRSGFVDVNGKVCDLKSIPFGCVQGSILGPALFNIYTSKLQSFTAGAFSVGYADDTYIGISCDKDKLAESLIRLHQIANNHIEWISSLGMVINKKKNRIYYVWVLWS